MFALVHPVYDYAMLQGLEYNGKVCQDIKYAKVQGMTTQMFTLFWTAGCV